MDKILIQIMFYIMYVVTFIVGIYVAIDFHKAYKEETKAQREEEEIEV